MCEYASTTIKERNILFLLNFYCIRFAFMTRRRPQPHEGAAAVYMCTLYRGKTIALRTRRSRAKDLRVGALLRSKHCQSPLMGGDASILVEMAIRPHDLHRFALVQRWTFYCRRTLWATIKWQKFLCCIAPLVDLALTLEWYYGSACTRQDR